jgi:multidrug efflux pump subunit AcrA (membrane-fusion protein)
MSAKVAFLERSLKPEELKPRIAVHSSSLITRDDRKYVFLIKDDIAIETPVTTGEQLGEMTEVLEGVKPGDKIIMGSQNKIKNKTRVKIAEK